MTTGFFDLGTALAAPPSLVKPRPLSPEPGEMEPPSADHVEAVGWLLTVPYMVALLVFDATGVRVGELKAATIGDLDESRKPWLVRAAVAKTRRSRWVELPDDRYAALVERLPAREDRDAAAPLFTGVTADRFRIAIGLAAYRRRKLKPFRPARTGCPTHMRTRAGGSS